MIVGVHACVDDASVHVEQFPEALDAPEDAALLERWERLIGLRDQVNKALELARSDGRIGGALEARVVVQPPDDDTRDFLLSFGDRLVTEQQHLPEGKTAGCRRWCVQSRVLLVSR